MTNLKGYTSLCLIFLAYIFIGDLDEREPVDVEGITKSSRRRGPQSYVPTVPYLPPLASDVAAPILLLPGTFDRAFNGSHHP